MRKTIPKLLTLVCLLAAIMGLSLVTAHAATVTGSNYALPEFRFRCNIDGIFAFCYGKTSL